MAQQPRSMPQSVREAAWKVGIEGEHAERKIALEATRDIGVTAARMVFLLNGAAIIALLALIGSLYAKDSAAVSLLARNLTKAIIPGMKFFISGASLSALLVGVAYLNWSILAQSYWLTGHWFSYADSGKIHDPPKWYNPFIETSRLVGIGLFFGALFCFLRGSLIVAKAFHKAIF